MSEVIPHDLNTFLVESRSRPGEHHITDLEELTCSCESFQFHKTCAHLKSLMPTETSELELAPPTEGEPPMKQLAPYDEFKTKIESLRKTAETITVTDIGQTAEMKIARATRLEIRQIRIAIEHRHKDLKADVLAQGRKIDAGKNELLAVLEPLELRLADQENFIERETLRIQAEKRVARTAEITPYLLSAPLVDLGVVADDAYANMLQDAIGAHAARLDRARKEKEEAEAKARAEAEERERIRLENERLKKEAAEMEAAAKAAREAAEAKLREERAEADRQRKEAAEKARKEREEIEAKARAEKEAAEAKARKERLEAEKKAKAEREAREKAEAELAAARAKEEAERKRIADEAERAAKAPDKEKLLAFAVTIRALAIPELTSVPGRAALNKIGDNVRNLAAWVETKAREL